MVITPERAVDEGSASFFRRNRARRLVAAAVVANAMNSTSGPIDLSSFVGPAAWPDYVRA